MKLYAFPLAPNPRKVIVYLKEKGIDLPVQSVDLMAGENRTPEFLKKNPMGGVPVLELDDGSHLSESLAIMRYLEELHPDPPMFGTTPLERARVCEVERICELGVLAPTGTVFQNTAPMFAGRIKQSPEAAETGRMRLANNLGVLDERIGSQRFVAGDRPTVADCTLFAALQFGEFVGTPLDPGLRNIGRWYGEFKSRPSASV